jgi:cell division transport system permease protein
MRFLSKIFRQTGRNLKSTWPSQFMTLLTVSLSVLIFSFFFLIYTNMIKAGERFGEDLRLVVYLEEEPVAAMQAQLRDKITQFAPVEDIRFVSRQGAFDRFSSQLGPERDVLAELDPGFLPPSIEVYPKKNLQSLALVKRFSEYLVTLPGAVKVQYGQGWIERFHYFTTLLRVIVILSGALLILTATFMVASTIRLAVLARQAELEILRLLGASNGYISGPFLLEGLIQGLLGSATGLLLLHLLYRWIEARFSGPGFLDLFHFTFFTPATMAVIMATSIMLCTAGSFSSIRKFLRI